MLLQKVLKIVDESYILANAFDKQSIIHYLVTVSLELCFVRKCCGPHDRGQ